MKQIICWVKTSKFLGSFLEKLDDCIFMLIFIGSFNLFANPEILKRNEIISINKSEKMISIEKKVRQSLKGKSYLNAKNIPPASSRYLDIAEVIVREAVSWQNPISGRIIDPYVKRETNTLTARYLGALGLLMLQGRCLDLAESGAKALTPTLEDLSFKKTNWGEFIVKEACMAYMALKDKVTPTVATKWKQLLSNYNPELAYSSTFTNRPNGNLYNFCTFALAGEAIKKKLGLTNNKDFMNKYIKQQLTLFDENGMYNDPHSPMTYDMVARMNLTLVLWAGYKGKFQEKLSKVLKHGALSQLLYQSPSGECPFGGRSNQQNFNEATFALICEFEAGRWAGKGDLTMAGAFKRAAALAINSIEKYLTARPIYFTKNLFPPETQHGRQKNYGFYGAYSLLIAGQLGFAALLTNNKLKEGKCPAECGGYIFITTEKFHKVFANYGGIQIEIDTNADFDYDATGLGRIHLANCPSELALSAPITAKPGYLTSVPPAVENISIGPGWDKLWLANLNGDKLQSKFKILEEKQDRIKFIIDYHYDSYHISELYDISREGLKVAVTQHNGTTLNFRVPLLTSNGKDTAGLEVSNNGFNVSFKDFIYQVRCLNSDVNTCLENIEAPNRNGIYKIGRFSIKKNHMTIHIEVFNKDHHD
ncbi:MAG: hypothetical protein PHV82_03005 [Victivallaceae bacterium]|nr:hypothetical protein [Victivallaceae bacterium]